MAERFTPGPWTAHNMINADTGKTMTPEEMGEYVCNAMKLGDLSRFLFVSGAHEDGGSCDICHVGNGPKGPHNAHLIAAAPDLYEAAPDLSNVISWLENGCDPQKAAVELRAYQRKIEAAKAKAHPTQGDE